MISHVPIHTAHLFPVLDKMLIDLLKSFTLKEWEQQTIAKKWKIKDVASHLLDGNLRGLSTSRDRYIGGKPEKVQTYDDLVTFLNSLNEQWVTAMRRISPEILIHLLELTGQEYSLHLASLNLYDNAIFPVSWAGQKSSPNWFHIAREYSEKFLHQQQIRDAVNNTELLESELYTVFLDICMYALPYTFRDISAQQGSMVSVHVLGEYGGYWNILKDSNEWILVTDNKSTSDTIVEINPDAAWKLFSKSVKPNEIISDVTILGNEVLGLSVLNMVSVMA